MVLDDKYNYQTGPTIFSNNLCVDITSSGGVIQSPNYPNDYPSDTSWKYILTAPPNTRILLTFTTFAVADNKDYVWVS